MSDIGLPCPNCRERGMIRIERMIYRCPKCDGDYPLRFVLARLGEPQPAPRLTLVEGTR